jgi:hypothetical protein
MRRGNFWVLVILTVIILGFPAFGAAQEKGSAPASPAVNVTPPAEKTSAPAPDPKQILQQMCNFLKNQHQFSFKAEVYDDQVYAGGRKLQYGLDVEAFFKRPDKLRLNGNGDLESKQLIYDGNTLTLYDKDKNHYGTMEVAGDIDTALNKASKEYGLHVGLAELGANRLAEQANQDLTHALYVGETKVRGVSCHHLALDKEKVHYQLWVDAGDKPLLRKVLVTQKQLPYSPQWTAFISDWDFAPQLADSLFTFSPPEGAQKIKFMPVKTDTPVAPKGAKPKKKGGKS